MTFDGKAFGAEIVGVVKGYLQNEIAPIISRMEALEKRFDAMPTPQDGKDAFMGDVRQIIGAEIADLKSAIEAIGPVPELPDIPAMINEVVTAAVSTIPAPQDGKSVTVDDVLPLIASEVEKRVRELPPPKDGQPGRDGLDVKEMFRAEGGHLVAVMSDGTTRDLGVFVGKDGEPGKPGKDGKDGRDGFNLEEFDATVMDDGRTVLLSFDRGDFAYKVELGFPVMIYRGVFKDGEYAKGDTVTWGGSLWHCDAEKTTEKPGDGSWAWTLCAKKGRDGKDGTVKEERAIGPVRVGIPGKAN